MQALQRYWQPLSDRLEASGPYLPPLLLRLILAWEFGEAGYAKLRGENWFAGIQGDFPLPFSAVPASLSWTLATWLELLGALALLLGLCTRFFAFSLLVLTMVAITAVHMPAQWDSLGQLWEGYRISAQDGSGNFKLPLLLAIMLLPLIFQGAGRVSLDFLLARAVARRVRPSADALSHALGLAVIGLPLLLVLPAYAAVLVLAAVVLALLWWRRGSPPLAYRGSD